MPTINDFLNIEMKESEKEIEFNGNKIKVKQYLPVNEKLRLIQNVLSLVSQNEYSFVNPIQLKVYTALEILKFYTDIEIDENINPSEIYDSIINSGLYINVLKAISEEEIEYLENGILDTIDAYYSYRNSILGIIESVVNDYSEVKLSTEELTDNLKKAEGLELVKNIVEKLG